MCSSFPCQDCSELLNGVNSEVSCYRIDLAALFALSAVVVTGDTLPAWLSFHGDLVTGQIWLRKLANGFRFYWGYRVHSSITINNFW